jgi:hypothetical protein
MRRRRANSVGRKWMRKMGMEIDCGELLMRFTDEGRLGEEANDGEANGGIADL